MGDHSGARCDHAQIRKPRFAIVKLGDSVNPAEFYGLLLANGHMEVSFVHDLWESPYLQKPPMECQPMARIISDIWNPSYPESSSIPQEPLIKNPMPLVRSPPVSPAGPLELSIPVKREFLAHPGFTRLTTVDPISSSHRTPSPLEEVSGLIMPTMPNPTPNSPFGGKSRTQDEGYAVCQLCENKLMASRISNLTNHVRRHASLKQYSCKYCPYSHNEMAKVRLHMIHNHKETDPHPIDNMNDEMQHQWDMLMEQCFPGFASKETRIMSRLVNAMYNCIECGNAFKEMGITQHIATAHGDECVPYCCDKCGYMNADEWKVRLHITVRHPEEAAQVNVNTLERGSNLVLFKQKYFPSLPGSDEEEEKLLSQLKELARTEKTAIPQDSESRIKCEVCLKMMDFSHKSLCPLLVHAKRHHSVKQFQCSQCSYASSESAHVRTHLLVKHCSSEKVLDKFTPQMQTAWLTIMKRCYPSLSVRIDTFKFKRREHEEDDFCDDSESSIKKRAPEDANEMCDITDSVINKFKNRRSR